MEKEKDRFDSNDFIIYFMHNRITKENSLFLMNNEELAKRHFIKSVNLGVLEKPEEFELWKVGVWNRFTGLGEFYKEKELVMLGYFEKHPDSQVKKVVSSFVEEILGEKIEQILKAQEIRNKKLGDK